jgi:hypothetical protein
MTIIIAFPTTRVNPPGQKADSHRVLAGNQD